MTSSRGIVHTSLPLWRDTDLEARLRSMEVGEIVQVQPDFVNLALNWQERITNDLNILVGKPIIKGNPAGCRVHRGAACPRMA